MNAATLTPGCVLLCPLEGCGAQSIQGPGRGDVGIVVTASDVGVVHILPIRSGSVHKSVDGSLYPLK